MQIARIISHDMSLSVPVAPGLDLNPTGSRFRLEKTTSNAQESQV